MTTHVEQVDTRAAPRGLLERMHEYYVAVQAEELPDDPPTPTERRILDWRHWPDGEDAPRWLLWDDDDLVAVAVAWVDLDQNLENGFARVHVRGDRRGQGLMKRIAAPVLDWLEEHGRTRVDTYVLEGSAEESLCARIGLRSVYREKRSRLVLADVDRALMQSWVGRAPERASAYHLLASRTPFPDDWVTPYCGLQYQMNTAPMEDFEFDEEVLTPARWRSVERTLDAARKDLLTMVAVDTASGAFVGSTSVVHDRLDPAQGWQWETVVHPDHRTRGLGRWLKGANTLRVLDEFPAMRRIDTWNAGSNEPMLGINVAMGYATILVADTWQGETAEVRRRLLG